MCNNIYCIVQLFEKKNCFIEEIDANQSINDTLDRFFLISQLTNNLILIKIEDIKSKCVYLKNEEEYFLSICIEEYMD